MHRQENSMEKPSLADVSVIVPCFNEEHSIAGVLRSVPKGVREIIVVDNNSTDKSAGIATSHGARVISENTQGYGSAIRAGLLSARGDIVAVFDADNQYPPGELIGMLDFLNERGLDFVSASRFPLSNPLAMDQVRRVGLLRMYFLANTWWILYQECGSSDGTYSKWSFPKVTTCRSHPRSRSARSATLRSALLNITLGTDLVGVYRNSFLCVTVSIFFLHLSP